MLAVDTNVIVRLIVGDDRVQSPRARTLFAANEVWVATTVVLETEWVLRRVYRYDRLTLVGALTSLAGLPNVRLEDAERVAFALERLKAGADFADALHLAAASQTDGFATFDKDCVRAAVPGGTPVGLL